MKWKWLSKVCQEITLAEREYRDSCEELDGFERFVKVISRLRALRALREQLGEGVSRMDHLLAETFIDLDKLLAEHGGMIAPYSKDFDTWADEVEEKVKDVDELFLGFDSEQEGLDDEEIDKKFIRKKRRKKAKYEGKWRIGQYRQKVIFVTVAWITALFGLFVAVGFLARDFADAQRNLAIQVERSAAKPLFMPAITMCGSHADIPAFPEYPTTEFPGLPIFGVSLFVRGNRSELAPEMQTSYPGTLGEAPGSPVENVIVSTEAEKCSKAVKGFDVKREMEALSVVGKRGVASGITNMKSCLHCLRIGAKKKELLYPIAQQSADAIFSPTVQVTLFQTRMFSACQRVDSATDHATNSLFRNELFGHAAQLENRGILDFNNNSHEVFFRENAGVHPADQNNFFCNVYFFSGFFYPSVDKADISYKYVNSGPVRWLKTGRGPYYTSRTWATTDVVRGGPDTESLHRDVFLLGTLRLFAEDANSAKGSSTVRPETGFALLERRVRGASFLFRKSSQRKDVNYRVSTSTLPDNPAPLEGLDFFDLGFDFSTFEEEEILTYPTMTWPEFLTDVFEFIGLFTGVCIFSIIANSADKVPW